jgi:hypothetical protein
MPVFHAASQSREMEFICISADQEVDGRRN